MLNSPKLLQNAAFSIPRPSKMNPNWRFWYENKPPGNPDGHLFYAETRFKRDN
jgi:hypothetical protein